MKKFRVNSLETFVEKAVEIFGEDKFDFSKSVYRGALKTINITCKKHGIEFYKIPNNFFNSVCACNQCLFEEKGNLRDVTTDDFIAKSKLKHGDRYSYNDTEYIDSVTKVKIFCNTCQKEFLQSPHDHYRSGCQKCGTEQAKLKNTTSFNDFVASAKLIHGEFFIYNPETYKSLTDITEIVCPIHGKFVMRPAAHVGVQKQGCRQCFYERNKSNTGEFIEKANLLHKKNDFDYSKAIYLGANEPIEIICREHGSFFPTPANFIHTLSVCPKCANRDKVGRWSKDWWIRQCNKSNQGIGLFYVLNLKNENENFIKIGITSVSIKARMYPVPYEYDVINIIEADAGKIWDKEKEIKTMYKTHRYNPLQKFGGHTECFSLDILKDPNFQMLLQN